MISYLYQSLNNKNINYIKNQILIRQTPVNILSFSKQISLF